jgi:Tol biopolymer transport system component
MKAIKLGLIVSVSAIIVAISCKIDNEPDPFPDEIEGGMYDLYLYDVNANVTTKIISTAENLEGFYSFSPDSKKILYRDNFGINEMNVDGSENRILMKDGLNPCYSPDGSKIAFTDDQKLYYINTDGTNKTQICNTDIGLWYPVWSKDGEKIACSSGFGLCIVTLEGNLKVLSVVNIYNSYEWSYDSKEIFFDKSVSNSSPQIYKYNIMQDMESPVTNDDKFNSGPRCNPTKNEILFTSSRADYGTDLVLTDQEGSDRRVIFHKSRISDPCWSPEGDKIVFATENSSLAFIDKNGENYKMINVTFGAWKPVWSNDGNYILYYRVFLDM